MKKNRWIWTGILGGAYVLTFFLGHPGSAGNYLADLGIYLQNSPSLVGDKHGDIGDKSMVTQMSPSILVTEAKMSPSNLVSPLSPTVSLNPTFIPQDNSSIVVTPNSTSASPNQTLSPSVTPATVVTTMTPNATVSPTPTSTVTMTPGPSATPVPSSAASSAQSQKININTADSAQLQQITGVGPVIAQRIIDYRTANGPFRTIDDLKNVNGIGDKNFEKMKDEITV